MFSSKFLATPLLDKLLKPGQVLAGAPTMRTTCGEGPLLVRAPKVSPGPQVYIYHASGLVHPSFENQVFIVQLGELVGEGRSNYVFFFFCYNVHM